MKASELADSNYTGPVRLKRGHDVFTSVSWTQGAPGERHAPSAQALSLLQDEADPGATLANPLTFTFGPKMVRLTRLRGEIGDCKLDVRYVPPDTELEPVTQIVGYDDYQTAVISSLRPPDDCALAHSALGLCAAAARVASRRYSAEAVSDATRSAEYLVELGEVCWYAAGMAYDLAARLSAIPRIERPADVSTLALVTCAGDLAALVQAVTEGTAIEEARPRALDRLAQALAVVRELAAAAGSDIFAVMSVNISRRRALNQRGRSDPAHQA